jgi:hypothetical protein
VPDYQKAIRNDHFKLVVKECPDCTNPTNPPHDTQVTEFEFCRIDELAPTPKIDRVETNLCSLMPPYCPEGLQTGEELQNFNALMAEFQKLLKTQPSCPGDGNLDLRVNQLDVKNWTFFSQFMGGKSSWYDFNYDGLTNKEDLDNYIIPHLGTDCRKQKQH